MEKSLSGVLKSQLLIQLILFLTICYVRKADAQNLIHYQGKDYFINGANIAWNQFGSDVGTHYQWGALYNASFFENTFVSCENFGLNCLRLWIHCDGRSSPEFDGTGSVTGLDTNFFSNLDDIFLRARNHNIMLIPCLWSFDMTKNVSGAGIYAGSHQLLITDTVKTRSYINNALIPMVQRYANQCNLLAWEIINEPEGSIDVAAAYGNNNLVTKLQMQRFVAVQAAAIHQYSAKMVTVGSASLKWNSDISGAAGNYWKDSQLQAVYNDPNARLDFYQIHYYDAPHYPAYDPFQNYTLVWGLDKPVLIGETTIHSLHYKTSDLIYKSYQYNYAGIMFWMFTGDGNGYGFNDFRDTLLLNRNAHSFQIDFTGCNASGFTKTTFDHTAESFYPTVLSEGQNLKFRVEEAGIRNFSVFNAEGVCIQKWSQYCIPGENLLAMASARAAVPGLYIIYTYTSEKLFSAKFLIR